MADLRKYKLRCSCPEDCILPEFNTRHGALVYIQTHYSDYIRIDDDTWTCPNTTTDIYISRV